MDIRKEQPQLYRNITYEIFIKVESLQKTTTIKVEMISPVLIESVSYAVEFICIRVVTGIIKSMRDFNTVLPAHTGALCSSTCMYLYILPSSGALNQARCNHGNNAQHRLSSLKS